MRVSIILSALVLSGCASWYSEDQKTTQIDVSQNIKHLPPTCRKLQHLEGKSCWDSERALIDLKKQAADSGASHLVITDSDFGFWCQKYHGDAYQCE